MDNVLTITLSQSPTLTLGVAVATLAALVWAFSK